MNRYRAMLEFYRRAILLLEALGRTVELYRRALEARRERALEAERAARERSE